MLEHTPLTTKRFNGLFARSNNLAVPYDHFIDCRNLKYNDGVAYTREGSELDITLSGVRRQYIYHIQGQASRKLVLGASGKLYDTTVSLITPILDIAAMTDFNAVTLNSRCYITPHNGETGLANEFVYVYNGTGTARKAAGIAPTNQPTAGNSGSAGNVEPGFRLISVAYVTNSGFITGMSPAVEYTGPGSLKISVGNIQVGPASTVQRVVLATKIIITYDGNPENQNWFFVPNGTVNNNTATTLDIDFFDSELERSADYLIEQLAEIDAGVGVGMYNERFMTWGSDDNENTCWVSKPNEPESINEVEGFLQVDPGIGPLQNGFQLRSVWYLSKKNRTVAYVDNGDEAITWKPENVDLSIGTSCHGIGQLLEEDGKNFLDNVLIASKTGLILFDGTADKRELTWKIDQYWKRINKDFFHTIEICINPFAKEICVAIPLDSSETPNYVLYGDYSDGLDPEKIKWCPWSFPNTPTTIAFDIDFTTKEALFTFGSIDGNIYQFDPDAKNDYTNAITFFAQFAYVGTGYSSQLNHFGEISLLVNGEGDLGVSAIGLNYSGFLTQAPIELIDSPLGFANRLLDVLDTERLSVKVSMHAIDSWFEISEFTLFAKPSLERRPQ